jgi:hypothetical protein
MSESKLIPPQENAVDKVERLKLQIAQRLKERQMTGGLSEAAANAERLASMVRARLQGGQVARAGQSAVREWMAADDNKRPN